jgi:hypothetical protein
VKRRNGWLAVAFPFALHGINFVYFFRRAIYEAQKNGVDVAGMVMQFGNVVLCVW